MGGKKNKPNPSAPLGRALIRDRMGSNKGRKMVENSMLHTTEIQDGYDWGRLNLQSVTEESSFQEFLSTAELAGTEFQAEKLNITFVNRRSKIGLLSADQKKKIEDTHMKFKEIITIPRRPPWTADTSTSELEKNERESFLEWRRSLAVLQEEQDVLLTPYEKNLEFWRQLWRVVERSDVIVQIVDGRNPLLFRCEDLEKYVKEVSQHKMNIILINKADFLTEAQRQYWVDYFTSIGIRVVFFSALLASNEEVEDKIETISGNVDTDTNKENTSIELIKEDITKLENAVEENANVLDQLISKLEDIIGNTNITEQAKHINSNKILSRSEMITFFRTIHRSEKVTSNVTTVGLVGYPNVGKSSTINALMCGKKVSVSATPGKTKHFQTLYLDKDIVLCDCPGLVMPSFVFTKAEMILNGILPVDQMRDHVPPINLITNLIPRHVIEDKYGIILPKPLEGEEENRAPTAEELLNVYAFNRGFMTANGQPDNSRAARYILKDFLTGKLLYCYAPPLVNQLQYHTWPERQRKLMENRVLPPREIRATKKNKMTSEELDKIFFKPNQQGVHTKGVIGKTPAISSTGDFKEAAIVEKPWKKVNKHENKKKKEKLRRVYAHLDQH